MSGRKRYIRDRTVAEQIDAVTRDYILNPRVGKCGSHGSEGAVGPALKCRGPKKQTIAR